MSGDIITLSTTFSDREALGNITGTTLEIDHTSFPLCKQSQRLSENTYQPFLKAVYKKKLSKDHYGQRAIDGDNYIVCENSAYVVKSTATNAEVERIAIAQNDQRH